jgi:RNA polymerase sigma-70 factor (sigma-E family)
VDRDAEEGFRVFVEAHSPALLGTAYLLTGDRGQAEDLLQVALLSTYRHWPHIRALQSPQSYVRRVMVNQRTSWWRRRRVAEQPVAVPPEGAGDDEAALIAVRDELWRAVRQLPPRTRAVLVLRYWEDLSEAETAHVLGCGVGTVKSLSSRGLRRLRAVLDEPSGAALPDRVGTKRVGNEEGR